MTTEWVEVMKVILLFASLLALAGMVPADEVVVRHEPTAVVHEHTGIGTRIATRTTMLSLYTRIEVHPRSRQSDVQC
jgi:hypothetical protein